MRETRLWLPFPPSVNNLFTQGLVKGKIRRFPSKGYKAWRCEAVIRILAARPPRFEAPVVVKLELTPRDSRPRDADNYAKPVLDALVEARVLVDDSNRYVSAVIPFWQPPAAAFGVWVTIRLARAVPPQLSAAERRLLASMRRAGYRLVTPRHRPSAALKALIDKGLVYELPGLLDGTPQGYALAQ